MTAADEKKSNDKLDLETLEVVDPEPSEVEENALNITETVTGEKIRTRKESLEVVEAEPPEEWM
ncbi:MAG: hypothetical protein OXH76_05595 [Boseongicola sp.]|nr:hypothetical protein [Boseongicola sp.]